MPKPRSCDIFCTVVDNFGDIGVCWRLASDLASRGLQVRLWVDDASALQWMAPAGHAGIRVLPWDSPLDLALADLAGNPCELLIETFGCDVAPEFLTACASAVEAGSNKPVWINLEYLTAEAYAERSHGLPSRVRDGPAEGWIKTFFYPGFAQGTGGLLREPDLAQRQAAFDRDDWLRAHGIEANGAVLVSLFCYEPWVLADWLAELAGRGLGGPPVHLLVAAGRAQTAVRTALKVEKLLNFNEISFKPTYSGQSLLSISYLPTLPQTSFDELLWACDLNFVRGEDSLVRAIWAGKPFVWQIYPQDDGAHYIKLNAFLNLLEAPAAVRAFYWAWNAGADEAAALPDPTTLADLADFARAWLQAGLAERLLALAAQPDLTSELMKFVRKNR